jgi:hypothetical protein
VKHGLFAKEVVIPLLDGDGAEIKFQTLVRELFGEFQPVGILDTCLTEIIAGSLWSFRRGTRAERGCARMAGLWDRCLLPPNDSYAQDLGQSLNFAEQCVKILNTAREEIQHTKTLSPETYASVIPLVEDQRQTQVCTTEIEKTPDPVISDEFVQRLEEKNSEFEAEAQKIQTALVRMIPDRLAACALPPAETMDKILRYESQMLKRVDRALDKLWELQDRRKNEAQGKRR